MTWANVLDGLSNMDRPWILIAIPVLLILLFFKRRKVFRVSSRSVFEARPSGFVLRFFLRLFWILPVLFMVAGVSSGVIALAGPKARVVTVILKEVEGRVAMLIDDVSGSMGVQVHGTTTKIEILKVGNNAFITEFCKETEGKKNIAMVGLVIFTDDAAVRGGPSKDCNMIRRRVEELAPNAGTRIDKGLWTGLKRLIDFVDKGELISADEMSKMKLSLSERKPYIPKRSAEFCRKNQGLSLELFTDGDFLDWAKDRDAALQYTNQAQGAHNTYINPFHVIDMAHSLCIRTYFWSVEGILPAYKLAFESPLGMGKAMLVTNLSEKSLSELYAGVAAAERGRMTVRTEVSYNPLTRLFLLAALVLFFAGVILQAFAAFSHNTGKEVRKP